MGAPLYEENTTANDLWAASLQALYEYNPIQADSSIYRKQRFGKHLEIFFPDFRSFRSPNADNDLDSLANMMGEEQLAWLKTSLKESTATWKVISSHDPLGVVTGGEGDRDSYGQEDPAIKGRELELKDLLGFIHDEDITGVVSLTSDVHYTAYVNMSPENAEGGWSDFKPLDEFVIGPIHAGSFGPNYMDTSFGATHVYEMGPLTLGYERWANLSPETSELQSFGHASVSEDGVLDIKLMNIDGTVMFEKSLTPEVGEAVSGESAVDETSDGSDEDTSGSAVEDTSSESTAEDVEDVSMKSSEGSSASIFELGVPFVVSVIAMIMV